MKYILLIYHNPATIEAFSREEMDAIFAEVDVLVEELRANGELVAGDGLAGPAEARTVRVRDGVPAVTDGPFVESKEYLAGYTIIDVATPERALEIAQRWPDARYTAVELRPLLSP